MHTGVTFDPATIARYTNKVAVDPRYRAPPVSTQKHKTRSIVSDLEASNSDEHKDNTTHTSSKETRPSGSQKRKSTDTEIKTSAKDTIFSLPSFKKTKIEGEISNTTSKISPNASQTPKQSTTSPNGQRTTLKGPTSKSAGTIAKVNATAKPAVPPKIAPSKSVASKSVASKSVTSKSVPPSKSVPSKLAPKTTPSKAAPSKIIPSTSKVTPPTKTSAAAISQATQFRVSPIVAKSTVIPKTTSSKSTTLYPPKINTTKFPAQSAKPQLKPLSSASRDKPPLKAGSYSTSRGKAQVVVDDDYEKDPIADTEALGAEEQFWNDNYSDAIKNIFQRRRKFSRGPNYPIDNYSDDDMEVSGGFFAEEEEETRSKLAGIREDKEESYREKNRKLQKHKKNK